MINTNNWKYFYKLPGMESPTNMLYTPLVNPEETIMCMHWDEHSPYQKGNSVLNTEMIDFFFENELKHREIFKNYKWCSDVLEVDKTNRKIFIQWNSQTIHRIFHSNQSLDVLVPDWQQQLFTIIDDITNAGYYKMALYPHCFYVDRGIIKTFDFYSCLSISQRYLERSMLEGIIGKDSSERFDHAAVGDKIDFKVFFENTLTNQLSRTWLINPWPSFYTKLNI